MQDDLATTGRQGGTGSSQAELSQKAFEEKQAAAGGESQGQPANTPTADPGMRPVGREDQAPSGALDAEGHRPVLERSRKVR